MVYLVYAAQRVPTSEHKSRVSEAVLFWQDARPEANPIRFVQRGELFQTARSAGLEPAGHGVYRRMVKSVGTAKQFDRVYQTLTQLLEQVSGAAMVWDAGKLSKLSREF